MNFASCLSSLTFEADLAVVELAQRINFDQYKMPVALARPYTDLEARVFNGTGWGTLRERGESSTRLRRVEVPFVSYKECRDIYKKLGLTTVKVRAGMICAGQNNWTFLNIFWR